MEPNTKHKTYNPQYVLLIILLTAAIFIMWFWKDFREGKEPGPDLEIAVKDY